MDINANIQATKPIQKTADINRVQQNKTAQKQVQELSEPLKQPVFEDFSLEISQLTRQLQDTSSISKTDAQKMAAMMSKEKNAQEAVEDLFNFGNESKRVRERLQERMENNIEKYNRVEPEPATVLFDDALDVTSTPAIEAAENMEELIDVTGVIAEETRKSMNLPKNEGEQTPTEKIRQQLGGYIDDKGLVPEEKRTALKTPVERSKDSQEQLKEVTGKLIERPEQWGIEGNKPEKNPAQKGRELLGSPMNEKGVVDREANRTKTYPERAEERIKQLDETMGALIQKPKELTGKENTEEMTPAERANKALGNRIEMNPEAEKEKTPPEVANEKMEKMVDKMGERVDKHEKITGEEIDEDMTEMEKAKKLMGDRLDVKGVVPDEERNKRSAEVAEEKIEQMVEIMGNLVDKPEKMTGEKNPEEMSETEKIRDLMGNRMDSQGVVPEEEREKSPPEEAQENAAAMIEQMGENVNKSEALTGKKDTANMSEMEKMKETFGGRLDEKGVVPEEEREKNPVEAAKDETSVLQEKVGELVNKPEEVTGVENREAMTEAEKANKDMGNYLDKEGVTTEEEREHTAPERIRARLEELEAETGRLVADSPETMGDSRIAPVANRMTGQNQANFLNTANQLDQTGGPNMDKFISTTNALIEKREDEQLRNFLSGAQDQSGIAMSMYLTAASQRHLFA